MAGRVSVWSSWQSRIWYKLKRQQRPAKCTLLIMQIWELFNLHSLTVKHCLFASSPTPIIVHLLTCLLSVIPQSCKSKTNYIIESANYDTNKLPAIFPLLIYEISLRNTILENSKYHLVTLYDKFEKVLEFADIIWWPFKSSQSRKTRKGKKQKKGNVVPLWRQKGDPLPSWRKMRHSSSPWRKTI